MNGAARFTRGFMALESCSELKIGFRENISPISEGKKVRITLNYSPAQVLGCSGQLEVTLKSKSKQLFRRQTCVLRLNKLF